MLKRIKYISAFTHTMSQIEMDALIQESAQNNKQAGITGLLVATGQLFFQIIEGPSPAVDDLYNLILSDDRHTSVLLLNAELGVKSRIFPDWSMKKVDLSSGTHSRLEPLRGILETIIESRIRIESLTKILEKSIWEELNR